MRLKSRLAPIVQSAPFRYGASILLAIAVVLPSHAQKGRCRRDRRIHSLLHSRCSLCMVSRCRASDFIGIPGCGLGVSVPWTRPPTPSARHGPLTCPSHVSFCLGSDYHDGGKTSAPESRAAAGSNGTRRASSGTHSATGYGQ